MTTNGQNKEKDKPRIKIDIQEIFSKGTKVEFQDLIDFQQNSIKHLEQPNQLLLNTGISNQPYNSHLMYIFYFKSPFYKCYISEALGWKIIYAQKEANNYLIRLVYPLYNTTYTFEELLSALIDSSLEHNIHLQIDYIPREALNQDQTKSNFIIQEHKAIEAEYLYDDSLVTLAGKKYSQMRKQLNKLLADEKENKIRIERINITELTDQHLKDIKKIVQDWIETKKQQGMAAGFAGILDNAVSFARKCRAYYKEHPELKPATTGVFVYNNENNELICYGLDELSFGNTICLAEGKFNYIYSDHYPDLNKVINHLEAKWALEFHNIPKEDIPKFSYTLSGEKLKGALPKLLEFKRTLAKGREILRGNYNHSNNGYIVYKHRNIPSSIISVKSDNSKDSLSIFG